jgi:hypothetical protein
MAQPFSLTRHKINDPSSENNQQNSDFWVGVRLIPLSVFALRGGAATHHNPASASPTGTSSNGMWGWLAVLRVILPVRKASGLGFTVGAPK